MAAAAPAALPIAALPIPETIALDGQGPTLPTGAPVQGAAAPHDSFRYLALALNLCVQLGGKDPATTTSVVGAVWPTADVQTNANEKTGSRLV